MDDLRLCRRCVWHDDFSGACCNGDSEYRGDFTDNDFVCEHYEKRPIRHISQAETSEDYRELTEWGMEQIKKKMDDFLTDDKKSYCPICRSECLKVSDVYVCGNCFQAVWKEKTT